MLSLIGRTIKSLQKKPILQIIMGSRCSSGLTLIAVQKKNLVCFVKLFQHIQTDFINYIYQNKYTRIYYKQTLVIKTRSVNTHNQFRYLYIYTYINTCGHTDQYYIHLHPHACMCIFGWGGVWGHCHSTLNCCKL